MNAQFAQIAALAAHAKMSRETIALGGDSEYWSRHSTLKYVNILRFAYIATSQNESVFSPAEWIRRLPRVSSQDINLMAPNLASWDSAITVSVGAELEVWRGSWKTTDEPGEGWSIQYTMTRACSAPRDALNMENARERLRLALVDAIRFCSQAKLTYWHEMFETAEAILNSNDPRAPYHPDILPESGYVLPARQLLAACVRAWVFGGMGSWNDLYFKDKSMKLQYDYLTRELEHAILAGMVTAINVGLA